MGPRRAPRFWPPATRLEVQVGAGSAARGAKLPRPQRGLPRPPPGHMAPPRPDALATVEHENGPQTAPPPTRPPAALPAPRGTRTRSKTATRFPPTLRRCLRRPLPRPLLSAPPTHAAPLPAPPAAPPAAVCAVHTRCAAACAARRPARCCLRRTHKPRPGLPPPPWPCCPHPPVRRQGRLVLRRPRPPLLPPPASVASGHLRRECPAWPGASREGRGGYQAARQVEGTAWALRTGTG